MNLPKQQMLKNLKACNTHIIINNHSAPFPPPLLNMFVDITFSPAAGFLSGWNSLAIFL